MTFALFEWWGRPWFWLVCAAITVWALIDMGRKARNLNRRSGGLLWSFVRSILK